MGFLGNFGERIQVSCYLLLDTKYFALLFNLEHRR